MKRPVKTATKEIIWEYVEGVEAELAATKEGKFDPIAVKEIERKKDVAKKAEKIIDRGIVNDVIMDEYNALEERIQDIKVEIETLTGISVTVGTFAALIEANNLEIAEAKAIKDEIIATKKEEVDALEAEIKAKKAERDADEKAYTADLKTARDREAADHTYELKRTRAKENDTWEDEKAVREKELTNREDELDQREQDCLVIEELNVTLQSQVEALPGQIAEIQKKAIDDAEKAASRTLAIKEAAMKKEIEFDKKMVDAENANLKAAYAKSEDKVADLESKLEAAYAKMNELATKSVQAGQPVYANKESK